MYGCNHIGVLCYDPIELARPAIQCHNTAFACCSCDMRLDEHLRFIDNHRGDTTLDKGLYPIAQVDVGAMMHYHSNYFEIIKICRKYTTDQIELLSIDLLEVFKDYVL